MQKMGLFAIAIRKKRKYSSYYGVQGKIKPDLIKRNFYAIIPDRHWFTDVTEFHLKDQKLYLSPIIDGCTQEIISYNISRHPDLKQVMTMLDDAFEKHPSLNGLVFSTQTVAGNISTKHIKPLWLIEGSIRVCPGWVILLMTA